MKNQPSDTTIKNATAAQGNMLVFLAEDDIDDQELLIEALQAFNEKVKVRAATNGKKALNELENFPADELPCLIILDYNLPEVNGAEILKALRDHPRYADVPKVVWSTSNSPMYRQICLSNGARAYFVKPSEISGIETLAREMMAYCQ